MIRGELVNLRAVERADQPDLLRWFNDPGLMRLWGIADATASSNEVQRRIEGWLDEETRLGRPACLMVETLEGVAVGLVVLSEHRPNDRSTALSLLIGEQSLWGQGLGGDTLRTVVDSCFASWNLHRVWLRTEAFNERAQGLYRRCGFRHEATLRDATYLDGEYHDVLVFALLEPATGLDAGQPASSPSGDR
jgi:RimJ/RimL family protein N-acetyltransferase